MVYYFKLKLKLKLEICFNIDSEGAKIFKMEAYSNPKTKEYLKGKFSVLVFPQKAYNLEFRVNKSYVRF